VVVIPTLVSHIEQERLAALDLEAKRAAFQRSTETYDSHKTRISGKAEQVDALQQEANALRAAVNEKVRMSPFLAASATACLPAAACLGQASCIRTGVCHLPARCLSTCRDCLYPSQLLVHLSQSAASFSVIWRIGAHIRAGRGEATETRLHQSRMAELEAELALLYPCLCPE